MTNQSIDNIDKKFSSVLEEEREAINNRRQKALELTILDLKKKINTFLSGSNNAEKYLQQIHDILKTEDAASIITKKLAPLLDKNCPLDTSNEDKELAQINSLLNSLYKLFENTQESKKNNFFGLALSGGGIRSATFNLGLLQAFNDNNKLSAVDYLSTVSGGGYIGASLIYHQHNEPKVTKFPFERGNKVVRWIRRHASYLVPGDGLNNWALIAAVLRGIIINLIIIIPLLFVFMWILEANFLGGTLKTEWFKNGNVFVSGIVVIISFLMMCLIKITVRRRDKAPEEEKKKEVTRDKKSTKKKGIMFFLFTTLLYCFSLIFIFLFNVKDDHNAFIVSLLLLPIIFIAFPVLVYTIYKSKYEYSSIDTKVNLLKNRASLLSLMTWLPTISIVFIIQNYLLATLTLPLGFNFLFLMGCAILSRLLVANIFYALLSNSNSDYIKVKGFSIEYGDYLLWGLLLLVIGSIPILHSLLVFVFNTVQIEIPKLLTSTSIFALITTGIGWVLNSKTAVSKRLINLLLNIGVPLLLFSGLLWIYYVLQINPNTYSLWNTILEGKWLLAIILIWISLIISTNINQVSMHRYYRNRLVEAFFEKNNDDPINDLFLKDINIVDTGAPYPIINTNIVTIGSSNPLYANRLGDSFIFTPDYIGSKSTTWSKTSSDDYKTQNLGTVMAISGAAVDPNIGETKSWSLRLLMGVLNVRLGYWLINPTEESKEQNFLMKLYRESWLCLISREIFGFPNEEWRYVRLSDGGHFENLGLYELVRRQCKTIIVSDAGADPNWLFSDLSRAIQRVRVDFAADIQIDLWQIKPKERNGVYESISPFVTGTIKYENGDEGLLVYIKTTLFQGLPEDVLGYARKNKKFPDEPTSDQFFTEDQFEAYRILGYHAGKKMMASIDFNLNP